MPNGGTTKKHEEELVYSSGHVKQISGPEIKFRSCCLNHGELVNHP